MDLNINNIVHLIFQIILCTFSMEKLMFGLNLINFKYFT